MGSSQERKTRPSGATEMLGASLPVAAGDLSSVTEGAGGAIAMLTRSKLNPIHFDMLILSDCDSSTSLVSALAKHQALTRFSRRIQKGFRPLCPPGALHIKANLEARSTYDMGHGTFDI